MRTARSETPPTAGADKGAEETIVYGKVGGKLNKVICNDS